MIGLIETLPPVRGRLTAARPLDGLSWLGVGGPAEVLFQPADEGDLCDFLATLDPGVPVLPIGVCSNMIIRDGGIDGVVVRLARGFNAIEFLGSGRVRAGAASLDARVAIAAAAQGIDLTFLRTIPGAIGGAIKMNAGCYGRYTADVVEAVEGVTRQGVRRTIAAADLGFAYRQSALPEGFIVTAAHFRAPVGDPEVLSQRMQDALDKRAATQPVTERSCGSTFRNPAGYSSTGRADDTHEMKAWAVIDREGLRGATLGGAQMSEMHPNFLINKGGASAADLENLGELVRKKVFEGQGIDLAWEIMRVGKPAE
ncbi:MAG: UDP-N-acetylmuramate dehydrogenase [Pseudomonadota bacterium]